MNRRQITAILAAVVCLAGVSHAATNTWNGLGGDNNWTTTANWSLGSTPGGSDLALFDGTTNKACQINANINVGGISIEAGYGGTISQGTSDITVGASDFSQAGGSFAGGAGAITVNGSILLSGGVFTSTSGRLRLNMSTSAPRAFTRTGGTFNHNGGELYFYSVSNGDGITFTTGNATFYDLTFDYVSGTNYDTVPTDDFSVAGDIRFFGNRAGSGARFIAASAIEVTLAGDLIKEDGDGIAFGNGNVTIVFTNANQTIRCGQGGIGANLLLQGAGPYTITNDVSAVASNTAIYGVTVDQSANKTFVTADVVIGGLRVEAGNTLDAGGHNIWPDSTAGAFQQYGFIRNYGTISNVYASLDMAIAISSSYAIRSGTLVWDQIHFDGSFDTGSAVTLEDSITILGDLRLDGALYRGTCFLNSGAFTISVGGDFYQEIKPSQGKFADANDTLLLNGSGTQTVTFVSGVFYPKISVAAGSVAVLETNLSSSASTTVDAGGTLDLNGYDLSTSSLSVSGTLRWHGDETTPTPTLNAGSTVEYNGAATPVTVANWSYKTLVVDGPGKQFDWTAGTTYTVAESFVALGAIGNLAVLRSTSPTSTWSIDTTGASHAVTCVDVQDSTAIGPEIVAWKSVDALRNVNWDFPGPAGTTITIR